MVLDIIINELPYLSLNMIVKNEGHIIKDTLTKLYNKIKFDYYIISDTGSTDNTIEVMKEFFNENKINGQFYQDEWIDFGYNRTKAIEHSYGKSKYVLIFDADDEIIGDFNLPDLIKDSYSFQFGDHNGIST
jgi:glycosyltransferase involved in cell wall biosynthesis